MNPAQQQKLNKIFGLYGLNETDHLAEENDFVIINRAGIMKIKSKMELAIDLSLEHTNGIDIAVVKASTVYNKKTYSTFGEVSPNNCDFPHPVNIAEKRALSRLVLEVCGLYDPEFVGADEFTTNPLAKNPRNAPNRKRPVRDGDKAAELTLGAINKIGRER